MLWMRRTRSLLIGLASCLVPILAQAQGPSDRTIDFGIRPLALPSAIYSEALRHDRILQEELTRAGWNLRLHSHFAGADLLTQVQNGMLDAAILGDVPTVIALVRHDMLAIATTKHAFATIVSKKAETIDQLKGKRIGNVAGTSSHYVLAEALDAAGLNEQQVVLVEMKMSDMYDALQSGKIDAFAAWEPFPSLARENDRDLLYVYRGLGNDYLLIRRKLAEEHPEIARHLIAALLRAHHWLKSNARNPERAIGWIQESTRQLQGRAHELEKQKMQRIIRQGALDIAGLPLLPQSESGPAARLAKRLDFLKKRGLLDTTTSWNAVASRFAPQLAQEVLQQPGRYRIFVQRYE